MEIGSPELEESIWVLVNDLQWPLGLGPADVALVWIEDHPLVFEVPAEKNMSTQTYYCRGFSVKLCVIGVKCLRGYE